MKNNMNLLTSKVKRFKYILFIITFLLLCTFPKEKSISPNGDVNGKFYSLVVANRFEKGITPELARGKYLYDRYCAICHGKSGDGEGFNSYNLKNNFNIKPLDFTNSSAMTKLTVKEMKTAIIQGGTGVGKSRYMPPWGHLFDEYDTSSIITYIESFAE